MDGSDGDCSNFTLLPVRWIDYFVTFPILLLWLSYAFYFTLPECLLLSTALLCMPSTSVLYRQADVMSQCFEQFYRDHIQHLLPVSSVRKLAEFEQKLSRNRPKLQQMLSSLMSSSSFSKATQRSPRGSIDKKVNGIAASIKRKKKSIMGEDITPQSLLFNG